MSNNKNDFFKGLKVENDKLKPPRTVSSDRDVYTCLKLMGDTARIEDFLRETSQQEIMEREFLRICQQIIFIV